MPESLLDQLRVQLKGKLDERAAEQKRIDDIVAAAETEGRSKLTEAEDKTFAEARAALKAIDTDPEFIALQKRVHDLEDVELNRKVADDLATRHGVPTARITNEPTTYRRDNQYQVSFFQDAFRMQQHADFGARERVSRHMQEMEKLGQLAPDRESRDVGTGAFGALVVPQYLVEMYAELARAGRPVANIVRNLPLPDEGMTLTIPRGTTGTSVATQATENTAVSETDYDETDLVVPVITKAGQQDVSRQSLERGRMVDEIVFGDLVAAYAVQVDDYVLNVATHGIFAAAGQSVTYTDATPTFGEFYAAWADATQRVPSTRFMPATHTIMHPRRWGWLCSQRDTAGRPFILPESQKPQNAGGIGTPSSYGPVGDAMGTQVITDANVVTNLGAGTNEDQVAVIHAFDSILFEESATPKRLRFEQTTGGSLTVKLVVYGYIAFTAARQPNGAAKIGGTGLITPTFA